MAIINLDIHLQMICLVYKLQMLTLSTAIKLKKEKGSRVILAQIMGTVMLLIIGTTRMMAHYQESF